MSILQLVTAMGCVIATLFRVRTAANLQAQAQLNNLADVQLIAKHSSHPRC